VSENNSEERKNALGCEADFPLQAVTVLVWRQVKAIEASVAAWETARVAALDRNAARSMEILEDVDGHVMVRSRRALRSAGHAQNHLITISVLSYSR
jgi:hypothetical protein